MATSRRKTIQRTPQALVFPKHTRAAFERVSVCVDVELTAQQIAALRRDFDVEGPGLYIAAASKVDPEVAVSMLPLFDEDTKLHVTLEFRKNMEAPFPKLTASKMTRLIRLLKAGRRFMLRHAEVAFVPDATLSQTLALPIALEKEGLRVTGFSYELIPKAEGNEPEKGSRVRFRRSGVVELTNWLRTRRDVRSIDEAIVIGVDEALQQGGTR